MSVTVKNLEALIVARFGAPSHAAQLCGLRSASRHYTQKSWRRSKRRFKKNYKTNYYERNRTKRAETAERNGGILPGMDSLDVGR